MSFQNRLNQISPWGKLVLLVALMAIGTLSVLSILFTLNEIFFHFPLDVVNHLSSTSSVRSIQAAKIIQITTQIGLFVIPTICRHEPASNFEMSDESRDQPPRHHGTVPAVAAVRALDGG